MAFEILRSKYITRYGYNSEEEAEIGDSLHLSGKDQTLLSLLTVVSVGRVDFEGHAVSFCSFFFSPFAAVAV